MRIGVKSGCWTLLHKGHIWCLKECKKYCDYLIVLTNDDNYIMKKKGSVPITLHDRIYIIKELRCVDEVHSFKQNTETIWVADFKKNRLYQEFGKDAKLIVFHSSELINRVRVPGCDEADEIVFIRKAGQSVTKMYNEIR